MLPAESAAELAEGWRPGWSIGRLIDTASETRRRVRVGEEIAAVNLDTRGATESVLLGGFVCVNDLVMDHQVGVFCRECVEVVACLSPTWTVIEVQQRHIHKVSLRQRQTTGSAGALWEGGSMATSQDPDLAALTHVSSLLATTLSSIGEHQLTWATPCSDWDLNSIVDHVTGGNWFTIQVLDGHSTEHAMTSTMERFGGCSSSRLDAGISVADQLAAFRKPDVLRQTLHHVAGDLTGRQILRLRLHDLIVHIWDIGQTLDPPTSLPDELVRWALTELSDEESLTPKHFGLTAQPSDDSNAEAAAGYLSRFGRYVQPERRSD